MKNVALSDFNMSFEERGSGLPLLLIHGYPLDRTLWQPQLEALSGHARLLALDLRGHGNSSSPSWDAPESHPHTMEMLAGDCAAFLDAIGVDTPIVLCGLSMGGYVSLAFQRLYPQRLAGLVLVATRAASDSPEGKAGREKSAQVARQSGAEAIVQGLLPRLFSMATYQDRPAIVEYVRQMMLATPLDTIIADLIGMRDRPDATDGLAHITCPTLVIHGSDDQIIPAAEAQAMAGAIPGAAFHLLPGAGHLLNLEQPQAFNQAILNFLQQRERA